MSWTEILYSYLIFLLKEIFFDELKFKFQLKGMYTFNPQEPQKKKLKYFFSKERFTLMSMKELTNYILIQVVRDLTL